jgi:hypothetical protein
MVKILRCVCRGWRDALSYAAIKVIHLPRSRPLTRQTSETFAGVVTLDLSVLRMSEAEGEALHSLRALRVLRIRDLQASTLPSCFAELPLEHLSLGMHSTSERRFTESFRAKVLLPPLLAGLRIRIGHRLGLERFATQLQSLGRSLPRWEGGGAATLGGIVRRSLPRGEGGGEASLGGACAPIMPRRQIPFWPSPPPSLQAVPREARASSLARAAARVDGPI